MAEDDAKHDEVTVDRAQLVSIFTRWEAKARREGWDANPRDPEASADAFMEFARDQSLG